MIWRALPLLALLPSFAAAAPVPVTEIAPGTAGVARTVLEGSRIQEIPLRFLGLLRGAAGPGHDLYLVRLEGPEAERVGVASGMSGSPVYVGERIVGALSYRMGFLPKEPVAGVTPIEDLLDAARVPFQTLPASNPGESHERLAVNQRGGSSGPCWGANRLGFEIPPSG